MNRGFKYICSICGIITVFALGNFVCYKSAMNHFDSLQQESEDEISQKLQTYVSDEIDEKYQETVDAEDTENISAGTDDNTLGVQTVYEIQSYDSVNGSITTDYETLPEELVGLDRDGVDSYCKKYMNDLSTDEYLAGLQSMGVVSFSTDRLIVKKIYDSSKVQYKYYLIAIEGEVVVYYGDKKNVYEYTGIETSTLNAKERKALKNGIEVKDESELYGILENYSS